MPPVEAPTLVSAFVDIARKQLTGVSEVDAEGGRVRVIWSGGIPVAAEEIGIVRAQQPRDPRERNRNAILACLRWQPAAERITFRETPDVLRGVPQNPVALGPLIVISARRGFGPDDAATFVAAREEICPLLCTDALELAKRLELRPNELKLLELLDGASTLRVVLTRCELDELHSVQLLVVMHALELLKWGPPRPSARPEVVPSVVVPRHTPVSRPSIQAMQRVTPSVIATKTPSAPGDTRISVTPPTPSAPPISSPNASPMPISSPSASPGPISRPNASPMPLSRPSGSMPAVSGSSPPLGSSPVSSPPSFGPASGRMTPRSSPSSGSSPPRSSADARVEAADLFTKGKAALKIGQTKQAQELFTKASTLAPEMYEYLLQEALLEYLSAKSEEDRERLTKRLEGLVVRALTKDRKLAVAHRVRGYLALATGQDDPALKAFKMAKDLDPEDLDAQRHYLVLMRRMKR